MQFIEAILKTGKTMVGYVTNTYGSQIQMLVLKDEKLTFTSFSKSALDKINELRPLTETETKNLQSYIAQTKEIGETEFKIRQLQAHSDYLRNERDDYAQELLKEALRQEKKETEILSLPHIEESLTDTGFKNLFFLQRNGVLLLGEKEEILFINEYKQVLTLLAKHAQEIASFINENGLTQEKAVTFFSPYAFESTLENIASQHEKQTQNEEAKKEAPKGLNFVDIKDKLNEHGFQTLKKLQETRLLTIHDDGSIDFGEIGNIPLFKDMLSNPKLLVDILNQPAPTTTFIPLPLFKGVEGLLKQIERQFDINKK